jgi:two-component system, response regulator
MAQVFQDNPAVAPERVADILLVEDDVTDAQLVLRALDRGGFAHRVEHVTDGAQALDYISSSSLFSEKTNSSMPRLILLDLNLRKLGGLHVLRQLKANDRTRSIPVIMLTSSKLAIELVESYKLGVNSYVIKPNEADRFAKVVQEISHYWLAINEPPPV